jgi:hypothetical protein
VTDLADSLPDDPGRLKAMLTVRTRAAHLEHEQAKAGLKSLMPECTASDRPWHSGQTLEIRRIH